MPQPQGAQSGARDETRPSPVQLTAVALRGAGQVYDMQMSAARVLLRTQARAAAAFGWPDWSGLFDSAEERSRHLFSTAAEQVLNSTQRATEAVTDLQREVGRLVESQTTVAADSWQRGLEELGSQTEEGLSELRETTRRTVDEARQATQAIGEAAQQATRESGGAMRQAMREGGDAARQGAREAGETARQGSEAARQGAREGGERKAA